MVEEQNPDRFPSHAWDQSALHRFLGHQPHGPAGAALWRVATHHGDDPLLLAVFQNRRSAGPLLVVECGFETTGSVTMADLPNRLRSEWHHAGNPRCTNALGQLQERHGSQDDTDLLYAAAQQPRQFVLVFRFDFDTQGWASHTPSMRQNISEWNCFYECFQAVKDLAGPCPAAEVLRGGVEIVDQLSEEWGAMCAGNPASQPFCRPEWTRAYCHALAPKANLLLVPARVGGEIKAVLPLIEEATLFCGLPVRKLTGAASFYYRFDIACGSEPEKEAAIHAVWQAVKELGHWDVIEFPQMPHGADLETLLYAAQEEGYPADCREGARNAYIPVAGWDGDPDYWLLRCGRHFRHTFRTAARKLPAGAEVSLRRVTSADPESLRTFYALECSGWKRRGRHRHRL